MKINELNEIKADPAYLHAAERSRSQAQATQRTFGKSPEEKAAARRTELKRDRGIAGYSKRHKAAHPEMYPKVTPQPAAKLRDPSTEYSDDYSTWAAGRRDTMEHGSRTMAPKSPAIATPSAPAAPKVPKVTSGGATPAGRDALARRIAAASGQSVAESSKFVNNILENVTTLADVRRVSRFIKHHFGTDLTESAKIKRDRLLSEVKNSAARRRAVNRRNLK